MRLLYGHNKVDAVLKRTCFERSSGICLRLANCVGRAQPIARSLVEWVPRFLIDSP